MPDLHNQAERPAELLDDLRQVLPARRTVRKIVAELGQQVLQFARIEKWPEALMKLLHHNRSILPSWVIL